MKIQLSIVVQVLFFVLIELLLFFGTTFSKFHLIGPIYLFEVLLVLTAIIALAHFLTKRKKFITKPILVLLGISMFYLSLSIFLDRPFEFILRQYALFGYLGISWLIFASFITDKTQQWNIRFIEIIAIVSTAIHFIYLLYLGITDIAFLPFDNYNNYSRVAIIGFISCFAFVVVFIRNSWIKIPLVVLFFFASATMGYSSIFLACFLVVTIYLFLRSTRWTRLILLILTSISILLFVLFLPEFGDSAAKWRLIFWKVSMKEIIIDYFGIIGHGFGMQYASDDVKFALLSGLNSSSSLLSSDAFFVTPMHNSFITMAFHIGFLPSLLFLVPLKNTIQYILGNKSKQDPVSNFLVLTLLGASVWVSFNVILELPHSSIFYWLIYFTVVYHFQNRKNTQENKSTLLISNAYPSSQKPYAGIFVKNQYEYLLAQGENIHIFFMKRKFTSGFLTLLKYIAAIIRFTPHYFRRYTILHVHFLSPLILLAYIYKRIYSKAQLILTSHGSDIAMVRMGGSVNKIYRILLRSFDSIIVVGNDQKQTIADKFGVIADIVLPAGIDERVFKKEESISKSNDFIFVGSFTELKGLDNLIKAIRILNDKKISYTVIGSGPLSKEVEKLKNDGFQVSIMYNLDQTRISELFNSSRWSILPSRSDAFGLVVSESMYCGTPVIVSPISSLKHQVDDGRNGIVLDKNNPESLANTMHKVHSMPKDDYSKYSSNAINSNRQYSLSNVCNKLKRIYSNV